MRSPLCRKGPQNADNVPIYDVLVSGSNYPLGLYCYTSLLYFKWQFLGTRYRNTEMPTPMVWESGVITTTGKSFKQEAIFNCIFPFLGPLVSLFWIPSDVLFNVLADIDIYIYMSYFGDTGSLFWMSGEVSFEFQG